MLLSGGGVKAWSGNVREDTKYSRHISGLWSYFENSNSNYQSDGWGSSSNRPASSCDQTGHTDAGLTKTPRDSISRSKEHKRPKSAWDYEKNLSLVSISKVLLTKLGKDINARKNPCLLTLNLDQQTVS